MKSEGSSRVISSTAARRWQIAQTRPVGCTTLDETDASPLLGVAGRDLRFSTSRARCAGSARRRRMCSRLLFRRLTSSAPAGSRSQIAALADSCVRSLGTFASPVCHTRLSPPARFCCITAKCFTHCARNSPNGSPIAIFCSSHDAGRRAILCCDP